MATKLNYHFYRCSKKYYEKIHNSFYKRRLFVTFDKFKLYHFVVDPFKLDLTNLII